MDTMYLCCAGVDVHLKSSEVCVRRLGEDGKVRTLVRSFGTTTRAILALGDWLEEQGVQMVAMESTGVYWKPLWNLLEGRVELMLVNARHFRNVPGRKTDKKDAQWLAELLQHGLLRPSFVPARRQRELCSWAKLCPGMNESAGKRKNSRTGQGNRWLRGVMSQAAWAASRTKNSYYAALYRRLASRRGKKRALIAVARSLLETIYHMLLRGTRYQDLGADYLDRLQPERLARSLIRRLEHLGHTVTIQPQPNAA